MPLLTFPHCQHLIFSQALCGSANAETVLCQVLCGSKAWDGSLQAALAENPRVGPQWEVQACCTCIISEEGMRKPWSLRKLNLLVGPSCNQEADSSHTQGWLSAAMFGHWGMGGGVRKFFSMSCCCNTPWGCCGHLLTSHFPHCTSGCATLGQHCFGMDSNVKSRATIPGIVSLPWAQAELQLSVCARQHVCKWAFSSKKQKQQCF